MFQHEVSLLRRASFFERTTNPVKAREQLNTFRQKSSLDSTPVARLFAPRLLERLSWSANLDRYNNEKQLAENYLKKRDYLRAILFGFEAFVTRETAKAGLDINDIHDRQKVDKSAKSPGGQLSHVRNAIAHGVRNPSGEVQSALKDEKALRDYVLRLFKLIF